MTDESPTIREMRKALKVQEKARSKLNQRLLQHEAREAIDQKARVTYHLAKKAGLPDSGTRFLLRYAREQDATNVAPLANVLGALCRSNPDKVPEIAEAVAKLYDETYAAQGRGHLFATEFVETALKESTRRD